MDTSNGHLPILIVDDDRELCTLIREYLEPLGYSVDAAHTGPSGVQKALSKTWHAIILDVMLPGFDGFEVLRQIRKQNDTPVLMLTARGDEADQIVGLEIGADDYLPKGSSTRQLLARLHAITRRAARPVAEPLEEFTVGELYVNASAYTATLKGEPLSLTAGEFAILISLLRSKGRVKTRDSLLNEIRDRDYEVFDRSIDVQISALRRKLGDDPKFPRYIRTVRSAGYMLVEPDTE